MRIFSYCAVAVLCSALSWGQDPLKVDPSHFKVEFENDQVRVVRVHFDPHYKSVMNYVPPRVVIVLTGEHFRVTYPDGKTDKWDLKARTAFWSEGGHGIPENVSDKPFELIWVIPKQTGHAARQTPVMKCEPFTLRK